MKAKKERLDVLLVEKGYVVGDDVYIYKGEATNIDDVLSRDGMAKINEFYLFTFNDEGSAKTKATDTLSIILTDTVDGTNTHGMALFLLIKSYDENEREAFKAVHTAKADLLFHRKSDSEYHARSHLAHQQTVFFAE